MTSQVSGGQEVEFHEIEIGDQIIRSPDRSIFHEIEII
jgi:hypothetical protein